MEALVAGPRVGLTAAGTTATGNGRRCRSCRSRGRASAACGAGFHGDGDIVGRQGVAGGGPGVERAVTDDNLPAADWGVDPAGEIVRFDAGEIVVVCALGNSVRSLYGTLLAGKAV